MRRLYYYLFPFLILSELAACTGRSTVGERRVSAAVHAPTGHTPFNLPSLLGCTIDQVRQKLGSPLETTKQELGPEPTEVQKRTPASENWSNTFKSKGTTFIVNFSANTRKVHDIIVLGNDEDELMQRSNLTLTALNYIVVPVLNPENTSQVLGVRMIPRG